MLNASNRPLDLERANLAPRKLGWHGSAQRGLRAFQPTPSSRCVAFEQSQGASEEARRTEEPIGFIGSEPAFLPASCQRPRGNLYDLGDPRERDLSVLMKPIQCPELDPPVDQVKQLGRVERAKTQEYYVGVWSGAPALQKTHVFDDVRCPNRVIV